LIGCEAQAGSKLWGKAGIKDGLIPAVYVLYNTSCGLVLPNNQIDDYFKI
jgi:hypothetical protein